MQSSGQYDSVEFTALSAEDRVENSEVPKFRRESIRTLKADLLCEADQNDLRARQK
jgi:hypothetical protein